MEFLHLEDHEQLREVLKIALEAADPTLKIIQFEDSDSAIAYIEQHKDEIDLFILDIRVPGKLDGLGVAKRIRELGGKAAIVLNSAYGRPEEKFMVELQCLWMSKPWHLVDAARKLFPLAAQKPKSPEPKIVNPDDAPIPPVVNLPDDDTIILRKNLPSEKP